MHLGKIFSVQTDLASSYTIEIEVDITKSGLPSCTIVGLPDKAVEESRERVAGAIKNSGYDSPKRYKTVISLSPANLKKEGPHFDLPIALGLLLANQDEPLDFDPTNLCFVGELALDGSLRPINGALALTQHAQQSGFTAIYVPQDNAREAALVQGITVYPVTSLQQLILHLNQLDPETPTEPSLEIRPQEPTPYTTTDHKPLIDFSHIVDQHQAKRALEIAAAGGHNVSMYGPAGTGKTMLAKAFAGILPPLTYDQMLEATAIHSYVGLLPHHGCITQSPYRAPHHTSSYVSVIGGGTYPKPGEISLAHHGVLFMDEFPEFDKRVLESLREPIEDREVRISRAKGSVTFPSRFILLAAMNPPSAVYRDASTITPAAIRSFSRKISGPIMDRIDIWCEVPKIEHDKLLGQPATGEPSATIQKRITEARAAQYERLGHGKTNSDMTVTDINTHIALENETKQLLDTSAGKLNLSPRVYHKILKLSRTIADLDQSPQVTQQHILEALSYRPRDIV